MRSTTKYEVGHYTGGSRTETQNSIFSFPGEQFKFSGCFDQHIMVQKPKTSNIGISDSHNIVNSMGVHDMQLIHILTV